MTRRARPRRRRRGPPIEYRDAAPDDVFLTAQEAADMLRSDPATLANLRSRGEGLPYYKGTGRVRYKLADVMAAINRTGRGYSRARMESALASFPGLTRQQREGLAEHLTEAMWGLAS